MSLTRLTGALLLATLALGCDVLGPQDPFAEACEHLTAIPSPIGATGSAASAPEVATHTRYDVALPASSGGRAGTVRFASTLRGRLLVFLADDVPVQLGNAMAGQVTPSDSGKGGPCPELAAWYEFDVGVGSQALTLGGPGNTRATVGLVLETEADAL